METCLLCLPAMSNRNNRSRMANGKKIKASLYLCKYLPVVCAFAMLVHCVLLSLDVSGIWAENFVMLCFACMLFANDMAYGFCWVHRALGCYAVAVYWCCVFERHIGFGWFLPYAHVIAIVAGFVLFYYLIRQQCRKKY